MHLKTISKMCTMCTLTIAALVAFSALGLAQAYKQTNLVSDIQGLAQNPPNGQPDAQLANPWGLVVSSTSPWWFSDNNAGVSTLDDYEGIRVVIPSLFAVNLPTQQFENAVIANLNSVSPGSVPFYNQLFGIWNAAPGAARAQNTVAGEGCSNVPTWRESHLEQPIRVLRSCREAPLSPPTVT
jgi:hypothetical protein